MSTNCLLSDQVELDRKARVERERLEDILTILNPDWIEDFEDNLPLAVTTYQALSPADWAKAEAQARPVWRPIHYAISAGIVAVTFVAVVMVLPLAWTLRLIHGR